MNKVRTIAVDLLTKVEQNQAYSTVSLQQVFEKQQLSVKDRGLLTELFYGTIQRQLTLDYYLQSYLQKAKKIDGWVRALLRMSVYQLVYLDKVPDHAVLFEAVQIAKKRGHQGIAKFVNGVLRNIQRNGVGDFEEIKDVRERVSVQYSMPLWIVELLEQQYGWDTAVEVCQSLLTAPHLSVRIQAKETTPENMIQQLAEEGIVATASDLSPRALLIEEGNIFQSAAFRKGLVTVQDEASSLVAQVGLLEPGDRVLDTCAAPGGKTTHIASYLDVQQGGKVIALDLHEHKLKKIRENAQRLNVADRIEMYALDARQVSERFEAASFDAVFVDAPCSGLGLMRRKPEIKYTKKLEDLHKLQQIQLDILDKAAKMVKETGRLIYSTCTINQSENDAVIHQFLDKHPEFKLDSLANIGRHHQETVTILPQDYQSDGFYICRLLKK